MWFLLIYSIYTPVSILPSSKIFCCMKKIKHKKERNNDDPFFFVPVVDAEDNTCDRNLSCEDFSQPPGVRATPPPRVHVAEAHRIGPLACSGGRSTPIAALPLTHRVRPGGNSPCPSHLIFLDGQRPQAIMQVPFDQKCCLVTVRWLAKKNKIK